MLIFINTPAMAMTLGLHTLDEAGQESRPERRAPSGRRRRVGRAGGGNLYRPISRVARSLHLAQ